MIAPQLAKSAKTLDDKLATHAMEPKLDGFRAIVEKRGQEIFVWSRAGNEHFDKMPEVEAQLRTVPHDFVVDGEIIFEKYWTEMHGKDVRISDFSQTMKIIGSYADKAITRQNLLGPLQLVVFDLLVLDGIDHTEMPDKFRRGGVELIIGAINRSLAEDGMSPLVHVSPRWEPGEWKAEWYDDFIAIGAEGIMLKDPDATYAVGKRSGAWLKHKKVATADVVFMGITEGKDALEGLAGAVVFGQMNGRILKERGKCSGMTDKVRREITDNWQEYTREQAVFEIAYNGFVIADGAFRHPQFKGFREDKVAAECEWTESDV